MAGRRSAGAPQGVPAESCIVAVRLRTALPSRPDIVDNPTNSSAGATAQGPADPQAANSPPPDHAELARALRAQLATVTGGLAPEVYANAWWDWYLQLAKQPTRQVQLMQDAIARALDSWGFAL